MNLLGGGFTCVFTDHKLEQDEPPVFKFSSLALEAACYALPEREPGDPREESDYQALENQCLDQLRLAAHLEPAASLLSELQSRQSFKVLVCDPYRKKNWPLGLS